jgi:hypothetical protein
MAGTALGVTAHAARSVPVTHATVPVVVAVRSGHTVVGKHRWCGDSGALVGPGCEGITFHLATDGVSEVRSGAVTAAAAGAQAMRLVA